MLFFIRLETRRVHLAGIMHDPNGAWMQQIGRNLTDAFDGFLSDVTHLILDRDSLYTEAFRGLLEESGVKIVRLPRKSPNLNAYAERFVLSIRRECLNRIVPLGVGHLRRAVNQYLEHYHTERHHQGLGSELIDPGPTANRAEGTVVCRERLGGMLRYYYREAA